MKSRSTLISRLLPKVILVVAASAVILGVFVILHAYGTRQRGTQRAIQIRNVRSEPVAITEVKVKGVRVESNRKFVGDTDWLNGLTVTIKNLSDKPVSYVTVMVLAPNEKNGIRKKLEGYDSSTIIELVYGGPPLLQGERREGNDMVPLLPGVTVDLELDENAREELHRRLKLSDASTDLRELSLSIDKVAFAGTERCWLNGLWCRRTPNGSWLIENERPRQNHYADKKSKRTSLLFLNNGTTILNPFDPLPRCNYRDIGIVPEDCTAYNNTGGLHCKWDNQVLYTSGAKNAIVLAIGPKICHGSNPLQYTCQPQRNSPGYYC